MVAPFINAHTSPASAKVWPVENLAGTIGGTPTDWDLPAFDDGGWETPLDVTDGPPVFAGLSYGDTNGSPAAPSRYIAPIDILPGTSLFDNYVRDLIWLARMSFFLPSLPTVADLIVNADNGATLKLNGSAITGLGGSAIDVAPFVVGWNVLTATVLNGNSPGSWVGGNPTMLIARLYSDVEPVTAAEPPVVIEVRPADGLTGAAIATLTEASDQSIRTELNATGSGQFTINRYSAEATAANIRKGNLVTVTYPQIDPGPLFAWFMEAGDFKLIASDLRGGENITFRGRGLMSYWDRAVWHSGEFVLPWWPATMATPPAGTKGAVIVQAGTYRRYTIAGGVITGYVNFTTAGGFSAYFDSRQTYVWPGANPDGSDSKRFLVHLTTTEDPAAPDFTGYYIHPNQSGVTEHLRVRTLGSEIDLGSIGDGNKPGQILRYLYDEVVAADRPIHPMPALTVDFTSTLDSNGDPWATTDALRGMKVSVGETYLETISKLISTGVIDVWMTPDLVCHAANHLGRDLTGVGFGAGIVRFVKGVNIADELKREVTDAPEATWAEIAGTENVYAEVELPVAVPPRIPREISLSGNSNDPAVLEALGLADLEGRLVRADSIGMKVAFGDNEATGRYLPGPEGTVNGKFWLGDDVTAHTGTGEQDFDNATERVAAITIAHDDAGNLLGTVEAGSSLGQRERLSIVTNYGGGGTAVGIGGGGSGGGGAAPTSDQYQLVAEKGQPAGYASLDEDGHVPTGELPELGTRTFTFFGG